MVTRLLIRSSRCYAAPRVSRSQRKESELLKVKLLNFILIRCLRQLDRAGASTAAAHLDAAIHALAEHTASKSR